MRMKRLAGLAGAVMLVAAQANASPVTVDANASIYDAGSATLNYGFTAPSSVSLSAGTTSLTFTGVTGSLTCTPSDGCITLNGYGNLNNPDGIGAAGGSYTSGTTSLSGITLANAGALVGVFLDGPPAGTSPTALDFSATGATSFTSLSPLVDQVFFIGDGLTGNNTGTVQSFNVPTGAMALYLGIADACGYSGGPSCYSDNYGTYSVTVNQQGATPAVPEPASFATLAVGVLGLLGAARMRRTRA